MRNAPLPLERTFCHQGQGATDPGARWLDTPAYYQQSDVLGYIVSAELAVRQLEHAAADARRGFVAHVLFRQRSS